MRAAAAEALAAFPSRRGELVSVLTKTERNDESDRVRAAARATRDVMKAADDDTGTGGRGSTAVGVGALARPRPAGGRRTWCWKA